MTVLITFSVPEVEIVLKNIQIESGKTEKQQQHPVDDKELQLLVDVSNGFYDGFIIFSFACGAFLF